MRYGRPGFVIPGAQKCGTTALAVYLNRHPWLQLAAVKEPDFFSRDARYGQGEKAYRQHFRRLPFSRKVFFEASVSYGFSTDAPRRLAEFDPSLKFILMTREPAERAYSAWNHYRTLCTVPKERARFEAWLVDHNPADREAGLALLSRPCPSFAEAIEAELESPDWTLPALVAGGLYADQLERFLAHFPRERVLVLEDRELAAQPTHTLDRVTRFLGMPRGDWGESFPRVFSGQYEGSPDPQTMERLRRFYAPHNERFFELAGREFRWSYAAVSSAE